MRELQGLGAVLKGETDTLPAGGQSIPELLEYSNYPRVDDEEELDTPKP